MKRSRYIVGAAVLLLALLLLLPFQSYIDARRESLELSSGESYLEDLPVGEFFATVALGGFRAVAVDAIWIRLERLQNERQFYEIPSLCRLISVLQPRFVEVWLFNAWNMAYNLSHSAETLDDAYQWIVDAINFLKKGIKRNPKAWSLYWYLGNVYYHKLATLRTPTTPYFRRKVKEETGKDSLEHAIEWFSKAVKLEDCRPAQATMLVVAYNTIAEEKAVEAIEFRKQNQRDQALKIIEEVKRYRRLALKECEKLRNRFPGWPPLYHKLVDLKKILEAYRLFLELEEAGDLPLEERHQLTYKTLELWSDIYRAIPFSDEARYYLHQSLLAFEKIIEETRKTSPEEAERMQELVDERWLLAVKGQRAFKKLIPQSIKRVAEAGMRREKEAKQTADSAVREARLASAGRFFYELYNQRKEEYKDHFYTIAFYLYKGFKGAESLPDMQTARSILEEYLKSHPDDTLASHLLTRVKKLVEDVLKEVGSEPTARPPKLEGD